MSLIAACLLLLWASPAAGARRSRGLDSDAAWTADPFILVPLYAFAILYLFGTMSTLASRGFWPGDAASPARLLLGRMDNPRAGAFVATSFPLRAIAVRSHGGA